jgi:putative ABC transport system ATP-binding protein
MLTVQSLTKVYQSGRLSFPALQEVSLTISGGEFIAVMGPSGSGKSTFLNILGCLDRPTAGTYFLAGQEVSSLAENELATVRNRKIGFVFQTFNLLPRLNALRNVELPMIYAGVPPGSRRERAQAALDRVGLAERVHHRPTELSGGERQRVAIARALVNDPAVILADEPTGNLDSRAGAEVMTIFSELHRRGAIIVLVTHEREIAEYAGRILFFRDGRLVGEETAGNGGPAKVKGGGR